MKFMLLGIIFAALILADNLEIIFPNKNMTGDDIVYRSKYISQCVTDLTLQFQAGGSSFITTSLSFPKYTLMEEYDQLTGEYLKNSTIPDSIGVYLTVTQKNDINDTSQWVRDWTTQTIVLNFVRPRQYFVDFGVHSQRNNPNGVPCDSYTLTFTFLIISLDTMTPYGKLIGLVSLLIPFETTANTTVQSTLLSKSQSEIAVTSSVASRLVACNPNSPDCEEEATEFNLADTANFRFQLTDPSQSSTYYMKNLKVSMQVGTDYPIDFTGLATVTSSSSTKGIIQFSLLMAIAGKPITITATSILSTSATRMLQNEDAKGVVTFAQINVLNELPVSIIPNLNVGTSAFFSILVIIFLFNIAFI